MHDLQPKHIKLNKEEKTKLLLKFNVSLSQFPKISLIDPSLVGGNFSIGDLVRILRKDEEGTELEYFRVVVK